MQRASSWVNFCSTKLLRPPTCRSRGGKLLGIKDYIKGLDEEMGSLRTFRREARRSRMDPDSLAEIESNIKDAEINVTKNIQFVKKALD